MEICSSTLSISRYISGFLFILHLVNFSQTVDILEECSNLDESHVTRSAFTCCSASPRQVPLQAHFDFRAVWRKCAVEPQSATEDPVVSAWRVYTCMVFSGLRGKPLRPSTFANLFTARYPGVIRGQILNQMAELEEEDAKFEVDVDCIKRTPFPKVTLIRNLFYDIEQEICEAGADKRKLEGGVININSQNKSTVKLFDIFKKSSTYASTDFAEVLCEACDRRQEMYHRNGDCCSNVPIPFPFFNLPYRYGNSGKVKQCTEDLADDVGLPSDTDFSRRLQYLCYTSCEHFLSGTITESDLWTGIRLVQYERELKAVAVKMLPKYFSKKYKNELLDYILENFVGAWLETKTFESEMKLSQRDTRNIDKNKLKNLILSCKTHRLIETVTNLYLNTYCYELYAESANEKSGVFTTSRSTSIYNNFTDFIHFETFSPNSKDGKDVTIDLDWNPGQSKQDNDKTGTFFDDIVDSLPPNFRNKTRKMRPSKYHQHNRS